MIKYRIGADTTGWRTTYRFAGLSQRWEQFKSSRSVAYTEKDVNESDSSAISFKLPESASPWVLVAFRRESIIEEEV